MNGNSILSEEEKKEIKEYNQKLAEFFEISKQKFEIIISTKEEIRKISGKNFDWMISSVKDNKVYILPKKDIPNDFFETIKHDIVHLYVHKKFPKTSGFIDEGLAEFFSRPYKKEWQKKLLDENVDIIDCMAGRRYMYLSAFSLVYFIIKKFGKDKLFDLGKKLKPLNEMSKTEMNEAFISTFKLDIPNFEMEWKNFIRN